MLVVEDEDNVAVVLHAALKLAGFEVLEARTATAALEQAAAANLDLIVLDVMMPDLDGFEVCRRLRRDGIHTPVIFLTARDATEDRIRGLTIGGDDYMTKPFSVEELVARARVILRRTGRSTASQIMRCADLVLDDDSHQVRRGGEVVDLSPTEYKLLRFLMRNSGRVLTRAQILDHVWDYDFNGESGVVETFVSSLRKKVDSKGPRLIQTVRGFGYRLTEV